MRRKEVLCAMIGGVVGAVLAMEGGAVLPIGAQDESGRPECTGDYL